MGHPPMMLPGHALPRLPPPHPRILARPPTVLKPEVAKKDDDLQELLRQYSALRDKIAKKKGKFLRTSILISVAMTMIFLTASDAQTTSTMTLLDSLLRKKRRQSTKPIHLATLLKKIKKSKKHLKKEELLAVAKRQLRALKLRQRSSRRGRNLKFKNNKKLIQLLKKFKKSQKGKKNVKVNYDYHPIMDYIK